MLTAAHPVTWHKVDLDSLSSGKWMCRQDAIGLYRLAGEDAILTKELYGRNQQICNVMGLPISLIIRDVMQPDVLDSQVLGFVSCVHDLGNVQRNSLCG